MVYNFLRHQEHRLQRQCLLCGLSCHSQHGSRCSPQTFGLCPSCYDYLPRLRSIDSCQICSIPLAKRPEDAETPSLCGRCIKQLPSYDGSISALAYEGETIRLIQQLKRHFDNAAIRLLSEVLSQQIQVHADWPALKQHIDYLIPAPMFWRRNLKRGNNHSQLLARSLSQCLTIPTHASIIQRSRYTRPQRGLNARQRRQNICGVFEVKREIEGMNLAIIDDVMTTGSTMNEMAKTLKAAGAKSVYAFAVARTPIPIK